MVSRPIVHSLAALVVVILGGCAGQVSLPTSEPDLIGFQLRDEVREELEREHGPTAFAMFCEAASGEHRAAMYWPWLGTTRDPSVIDDDVFALLFERDGRRWRRIGGPYKASGSGRDELFAIIGEPDSLDVYREAGVATERLPGFMQEHLDRIRRAYERENVGEAMEAAESLARLFADDLTCFEDSVSETALFPRTTERYDYRLYDFMADGNEATAAFDIVVETARGGRDLGGIAEFSRRGDGWVISGSKLTLSEPRPVTPTDSPE